MNNGERTKIFLDAVGKKTKEAILQNIAKHYGISMMEAFEEVTDSEAEHLLDYMTDNERLAASALMQKLGMRGF